MHSGTTPERVAAAARGPRGCPPRRAPLAPRLTSRSRGHWESLTRCTMRLLHESRAVVFTDVRGVRSGTHVNKLFPQHRHGTEDRRPLPSCWSDLRRENRKETTNARNLQRPLRTRPLQRTRLGTRTALSWRQRRGERYGKTAPRTRPRLAARSRVAQTRGALQPRSGEWGEVHGHGRVQRAACGFLTLPRPWRLQPPDAGAARVGGRRLVTRLGGTSPPGRREHFLKGRFQESRLRQSPTGSLAASGCASSFAAGRGRGRKRPFSTWRRRRPLGTCVTRLGRPSVRPQPC